MGAMGKGFLAYPKNMQFGVRVSAGNIGDKTAARKSKNLLLPFSELES
jgi:hypothetical protein